jgi:hypothetical protein
MYLGKMYKPMKDMSKMTDTWSKAIIGFERIGEILNVESQIRNLPGARPAPAFAGRIKQPRAKHCAAAPFLPSGTQGRSVRQPRRSPLRWSIQGDVCCFDSEEWC